MKYNRVCGVLYVTHYEKTDHCNNKKLKMELLTVP